MTTFHRRCACKRGALVALLGLSILAAASPVRAQPAAQSQPPTKTQSQSPAKAETQAEAGPLDVYRKLAEAQELVAKLQAEVALQGEIGRLRSDLDAVKSAPAQQPTPWIAWLAFLVVGVMFADGWWAVSLRREQTEKTKIKEAAATDRVKLLLGAIPADPKSAGHISEARGLIDLVQRAADAAIEAVKTRIGQAQTAGPGGQNS